MLCKSNSTLIIILSSLAATVLSASMIEKIKKGDVTSSKMGNRIQTFLTRFNVGHFGEELILTRSEMQEVNDELFGAVPNKEEMYNSKEGVYAVLPKFRPDKLISFTQYLLLCACGIYITFFSARHSRTTVIIFCFLNSYFLLTFTIVQFDVYKTNVLEYQFVLFFFGLILGFTLTILTNLYKVAEWLMIGFAIVTAISLICAQFFINFNSNLEWGLFILVYIILGLLFSFGYKLCNKDLALVVGALYGATVHIIYTGILTDHIVSFEDEVVYLPRKLMHFEVYLWLISGTTVIGLFAQYLMFIWSRGQLKDDSMDDFSESSFWA